ncbi:helix-turn-helix domain-containing protein [Hymenobacter setariae]|uniref:Helix-turn-helix domain-containing protein n=1 Tax=Hymenobacter setariae TaxID=2594794 RepID=A0A558BS69_9BACT|nr:helix-turn-helix domain-containing protein [Hymenobacter setariae]TVT39342.1 helix-turn-helix domain-containing protein [Hymenobacter setariae]
MILITEELHQCKQLIEHKLGWGPGAAWTSRDFEQLQERLLAETGVSLSPSTLRRLWGRVDYQHLPSATTLNTLAQFVGYPDWRFFARSLVTEAEFVEATKSATPPVHYQRLALPVAHRVLVRWLLAGIGLLLGGLMAMGYHQRSAVPAYRFSSQPVTRSIPNSVVFTYDAAAAHTDSVFIQQSWDPRRRVAVAKLGRTYSAMYYEPGFYQAQLVVGQQTVKKHPLLLSTQGWLGAIMTIPVPTYLQPTEYQQSNLLYLPLATVLQHRVPLEPLVPWVKYFNVGNFRPVPLTDFAFSCDLKNEYHTGAGACQLTTVTLLTTGTPIVIPLAAKGCVAELELVDGTHSVLGKTTNLVGFGVNFADWVHVTCASAGPKLHFSINGHLVYTSPLPRQPLKIIGVAFSFQGTGAVKATTLQTANKVVFHSL